MVADEVITCGELASLAGSGRVRLIDVREPDAYREGHIPGAVNLHPSALEHPEVHQNGEEVRSQLRPVLEVASYLRAAGICSDIAVCVYDDGGGYLASRLWWILDYLGHPKCRLLDGGLFAWAAGGGALSDASEPLSNGAFAPRIRSGRRMEFSDVIAAMGDNRTVLCNTLPAVRFAVGSIPGSINIPYTETFAPDNHPLLKTRHELEAMFADRGISGSHRIIFYCREGYAATQVYFAARYCGFENCAVYDGSMLDWSARGGDLTTG